MSGRPLVCYVTHPKIRLAKSFMYQLSPPPARTVCSFAVTVRHRWQQSWRPQCHFSDWDVCLLLMQLLKCSWILSGNFILIVYQVSVRTWYSELSLSELFNSQVDYSTEAVSVSLSAAEHFNEDFSFSLFKIEVSHLMWKTLYTKQRQRLHAFIL